MATIKEHKCDRKGKMTLAPILHPKTREVMATVLTFHCSVCGTPTFSERKNA